MTSTISGCIAAEIEWPRAPGSRRGAILLGMDCYEGLAGYAD